MEIGYKLSSEEHGPNDLVRYARRAEDAGMTFGTISDHFHPWIDKQGHSPFVWNVIGGIAATTERLRVVTGVTCPIIRMHPALIAQAAATSACMLPGRFALGVGSGEHLNEHVLGDKWPRAKVRLDMLEEAVEVMRKLWRGKLTSFEGEHYTVENARIYTLPDEPPPVMVAAGGDSAAELAGRIGDGFVGVSPQEDLVETFEKAGGAGKPKYCEVQVCWAPSEEEAKKTAFEYWPNTGLAGQLSQELALPSYFEQAASMLDVDDVASSYSCGPDPEVHLEGIRKFADAGYDYIAVHQIGPRQDEFFDFYEREVLPKL